MKAVRHIGIVVGDMERSLGFYRDLLGLKVFRVMDEAGDYLDKMLALSEVQVKTVKLAADSGETLVELLAFASHQGGRHSKRRIYSIGPTHIAFTVDNLDSLYQRLMQAGLSFYSPPQRSPDGYAKVAFCEDPDGTPIELVEVLDVEHK